MNEVWKPIPGYEGYYEVSNLGRVKSLPRATTRGRMMKLYTNKRNGYVYVCLSKEGVSKQKRVHIAVMEAFTDFRSTGFNADKVIDHIDCDKTNNCINNLEVVSQKENDKRQRAKCLQHYHGVEVIDLDTMEVFATYTDAARSVGGSRGEMVARVCRGQRSHYRNHRFATLSDYKNKTIPQFAGVCTKKASESLWR